MRNKRLGARYYMPWDPLQVDENIDGGHRVFKYDVTFDTFRTFKKKIDFNPNNHKNFIMFYDSPDVYDTLFFNLCRQTRLRHLKSSVSFHIYSFDEKDKDLLLKYDDECEVFYYHPFEDSLDKLINGIGLHRKHIRQLVDKSQHVEPFNKKLQFFIVMLQDEQIKELNNNEKLQKKLSSLILNSQDERIFVCFLCNDLKSFPQNILKEFDQQYFLGDNNREFVLQKLYPGIKEDYPSVFQKLIGIMFSKNDNKLIPLHSLKLVLSDWAVARQKEYDEEEENYRKFLESLNDGT